MYIQLSTPLNCVFPEIFYENYGCDGFRVLHCVSLTCVSVSKTFPFRTFNIEEDRMLNSMVWHVHSIFGLFKNFLDTIGLLANTTSYLKQNKW